MSTIQKVNQSLRTANVLLKKLNETYYVSESINDKCAYSIHEHNSAYGNHYIASVIKTDNKHLEYNGKSYSDTESLIKDITEYNGTLQFPADYYNPDYRLWASVDMKINWYLSSYLGMTRHTNGVSYDTNEYVLRDSLGDLITSISYNVYHDNSDNGRTEGSGTITKTTSDGKWISTPFKDAEDAVRQINTFMCSDMLMKGKMAFDMLDKVRGNFSDMKDAKVYDKNDLFRSIMNPDSFKEKIIPILEDLLSKLKA